MSQIHFSECATCGYKWKTGRSGHHSCSDYLSAIVKSLQTQLEKLKREKDQKWIISSIYESPELEENSIHTVIDSEGVEQKARFCFGHGEYWWLSTNTGKEIKTICYLPSQCLDQDLEKAPSPPEPPPKRLFGVFGETKQSKNRTKNWLINRLKHT